MASQPFKLRVSSLVHGLASVALSPVDVASQNVRVPAKFLPADLQSDEVLEAVLLSEPIETERLVVVVCVVGIDSSAVKINGQSGNFRVPQSSLPEGVKRGDCFQMAISRPDPVSVT